MFSYCNIGIFISLLQLALCDNENPSILRNPNPESVTSHDDLQDGVVRTPITITESEDGSSIRICFQSHNRNHDLYLKYTKSVNLSHCGLHLLGITRRDELKIRRQIQDIELLSDSKYSASMAFNKTSKTLLGGGFSLGHHNFHVETTPDNSSEVYITKRTVEMERYQRIRVDDTGEELGDVKFDRKRRSFKTKRSSPQSQTTLKPISATVELVLICDYALYSSFVNASIARNTSEPLLHLILYVAHMVSMMDDHYASMNNNAVNISIEMGALVILTKSNLWKPLTEHYKTTFQNTTVIDSLPALKRLSRWLSTAGPRRYFQRYDHAMLLTGYDLYVKSKRSKVRIGVGFKNKVCDYKTHRSASIVETTHLMTYDASTGAHEIGHSLGADHDGRLASEGCPNDNYVMNQKGEQVNLLQNRFYFSCCSQRSFYGFIKNKRCLQKNNQPFNNASITDHVNKYLPGEVFNADEQCYISEGTKACGDWVYGLTNSSICLNLWCVMRGDSSRCRSRFTAPSDGTLCGHNRWCIRGACVDKSEQTNNNQPMCDISACMEGEFKCTRGRNIHNRKRLFCIPKKWRCDNERDCSDGSDERNCSSSSNGK